MILKRICCLPFGISIVFYSLFLMNFVVFFISMKSSMSCARSWVSLQDSVIFWVFKLESEKLRGNAACELEGLYLSSQAC